MPTGRTTRARGARPAFTLAELMVAVAVLIAVVLAVGKIFGTVSRVTAIGNASTDVIQEAAALERQIRSDFERLTREGTLVIQSVRVPNDLHPDRLLNPALAPEAFVRADQLVFFAQGVQTVQTFRPANFAGSRHRAQGATARIYYGHAFQLPLAGGYGQEMADHAHDPAEAVTPWWSGPVAMQFTKFGSVGGGSVFNATSTTDLPDATQPEARQWLLARQAVILGDDDDQGPGSDSKTFFLDSLSARTVFLTDPLSGVSGVQLLHGRADVAATLLNDIRTGITGYGQNEWNLQQEILIPGLVYYPRAERFAPSAHRVDQALTNHVIASACSSFIVEWTYDAGVGAATSADGVFYQGVRPTLPHQWFGMADDARGVIPYTSYDSDLRAATIDPYNIERDDVPPSFVVPPDADLYQATFGYNRDVALNADGVPDSALGYTPWPTAIRITMVLHDPRTTLENGRTFQFVIRLPRRGAP